MFEYLAKKTQLYFLKRRVQKQLKGSKYTLTDIQRLEPATVPMDRAYLKPIGDGFNHTDDDCECAPALIPSTRTNGTEFWIVRHNEM